MSRKAPRRARGPGRPRRRPGQPATRDRVLGAARADFAERGLLGARLADVAAQAGITRASLLHHFPSKDDLYAQVVGEAFLDLGVALRGAAPAGAGREEAVRGMTRAYAGYLRARPDTARLILREALAAEGPGRQLLAEVAPPLLDEVAADLAARRPGALRLPSGARLRAALMQLAGDGLLQAASGSLRDPLWGPEDHLEELAVAMLVKGSP